VERLEGGLSQPLGVVIDATHREAEVELAVGDCLLLYTDGLVERRGVGIDAGIDGTAALLASGDSSPLAVCERIAGQLDADLRDDAAFLALRREPIATEELHVVLPARPAELAGLRRRLVAWLDARGADEHERGDIVLATHEAAMNAVEHAYGPGDAEVIVDGVLRDGVIEIAIRDSGRWRASRRDRRGRGEGIMEGAMDEVAIDRGERGSTVRLRRRLSGDGRA
jgi:anti-sigma regulatory factor (Ser/Thr protein kinase)